MKTEKPVCGASARLAEAVADSATAAQGGQLSWVCDLYRLSQAIADQADPIKVQQKILEHIVDRFDARTGCLALTDPAVHGLRIVAGMGLPPSAIGDTISMGTGILGWVAQHAEPLLLNGDLSDDPRFGEHVRKRASQRPVSSMCWPLTIEDQVIGVLSLNRSPEDVPFNDGDMDRVEMSVGLVTLVVENARLHKEQQRRMGALADANVRMVLLSEALTKFLRTDVHYEDCEEDGHCLLSFYRELLEDIRPITQSSHCALGIFDDEGGFRHFLFHSAAVPGHSGVQRRPDTSDFLGEVHRKEQTMARRFDAPVAMDPQRPDTFPRVLSVMAVPVIVHARCWGGLYVFDKAEGGEFGGSDELNLTLFANNLAMLLERVDLMRRLKQSKVALEREKEEQKTLIGKLQEAQSQLLQSEKLASIGQLAAGVAHEINNPVGYISSNLGTLDNYVRDLFSVLDAYAAAEAAMDPQSELVQAVRVLKDKVDLQFLKDDILELVKESHEGVKRVKQIVQDLKDFSHVDQAEWQWADLHKGLDSTLNVARNEVKYKADVIKEYGELPQVECIASQLNQVFMNLIVNAAHAIEEHGTITVRTGSRDDQVWVEVSDTGKGIPPENLKRIFDPFFTTKPVGKGTGLGLSLSYGIVNKHGGRIEVESKVGEGTTFRVWLPKQQTEASENRADSAAAVAGH